jgi:hypothetical protein
MAHCASGFFRRSSLDRLVDPSMVRDSILTLLCGDVRDSDRSPPRPSARYVKGPHKGDKNRIPAGFGDRKMKCAVPPYPVRVIDDLRGSTHADFDTRDVFIGCLVCRDGSNRRLQSKTHLHGVAWACARQAAVDPGGSAGGRVSKDGAVSTATPQPSNQLELRQVLTQGTPADPELGGQFSLRGQAIAVLQAFSFDVRLNGIQGASTSLRGRVTDISEDRAAVKISAIQNSAVANGRGK